MNKMNLVINEEAILNKMDKDIDEKDLISKWNDDIEKQTSFPKKIITNYKK